MRGPADRGRSNLSDASWERRERLIEGRSVRSLPVPSAETLRVGAVVTVVGIVLAAMVALLIQMGLWFVAAALLLVAPAFYLLNRYPMVALMTWFTLAPFLMVGVGGGRALYWLIHRALPVGTLIVIVIARWIGVRDKPFPKLGWPEAMMGGYLVLTITSIAYRSLAVGETVIYMYDHVVIPMSIYLLIRLLAPDEEDLKRLVPVLAFFLVTQTAVGAIGWIAPGALPAGWLNREERATGTLRHPNVYATALLFAGLYLAHYSQTMRYGWKRTAVGLALPVAMVMAVVTLSRASWLAAFAVLGGLFLVYRPLAKRIAGTLLAVAVFAVLMGGAFSATGQALSQRLYSQQSAESALSRLPVILASFRMIEARPLIGWGYENFDRYDQQFQGSIQGLYVPDKDHASHNFFLTLGAESGLVGLVLYLGPAAWWLYRSRLGVENLPAYGVRSKKLIPMLWLAMLAQGLAYNLSNNRVAFGLAIWWMTLGLIAAACDWRDRAAAAAEADLRSRVAAAAGTGRSLP